MESDADSGWGRICTCAIPRHTGRNTDTNPNANPYSDCNPDTQTYAIT